VERKQGEDNENLQPSFFLIFLFFPKKFQKVELVDSLRRCILKGKSSCQKTFDQRRNKSKTLPINSSSDSRKSLQISLPASGPMITDRVTRGVCEKFAQNVAQRPVLKK
jgi:hypothetical protein